MRHDFSAFLLIIVLFYGERDRIFQSMLCRIFIFAVFYKLTMRKAFVFPVLQQMGRSCSTCGPGEAGSFFSAVLLYLYRR